jgi:formylmethanofuran dehydrogenase subunit C
MYEPNIKIIPKKTFKVKAKIKKISMMKEKLLALADYLDMEISTDEGKGTLIAVDIDKMTYESSGEKTPPYSVPLGSEMNRRK